MRKRIITKNTKELYCLFSVDIQNSTKNKYENLFWDNTVYNFYEKIPLHFQALLKEKGSSNILSIWKYVGDEILFYSKIDNISQIPITIQAFKETLEFFSKNSKEFTIKGTAWTAQLNLIDKSFYMNKTNDNDNNTLDFIGPSVDCGFRLSKFASTDFMSISIEILDLCKDDIELQKTFYFLNSEFLKGVNNNERKYPIFLIKLNVNNQQKEDLYLRSPCNYNSLCLFLNEYYDEPTIIKYHWCISRITNSFFSANDINTFKNNTRSFSNITTKDDIQSIKNWFYENFEDPSINCFYDTKHGGYYFSDLNSYGTGHDCSVEIHKHFNNQYNDKTLNKAIEEILLESCCYEWAKK
ncbi:MAG: hypothetical protein IJ530_15985 [Treponema sp.]|uniref:hypothetical protein n=1 Tax=Treponema sp. TaxID=166 RepID=UPI0025E98862|nr:hypothetical protein [Treponema sp.]MBQ8678775.1 hypothetical protein [Treponema sp.]MBQ8681233.1 hypothetical protein [Treponema sp.]